VDPFDSKGIASLFNQNVCQPHNLGLKERFSRVSRLSSTRYSESASASAIFVIQRIFRI